MYKVCDNCGELFLNNEEHEYFEHFGCVCILCLSEGFEVPTSKDKNKKNEVVAETSMPENFKNIIQVIIEKS